MLISVPDVISREQITEARRLLGTAEWVDGRTTAGPLAAKVKDNSQIPPDHPVARQLGQMVLTGLSRSPLFNSAAHPIRMLPPMFSRYSGGQQFGTHVDNAIRQIPGTLQIVRADLSATLFISAPEEYDGGELCVEDVYGFNSVKLPAGHMVLYPSTSRHHVNPVTRGSRLVSFFWIQSMIRDDAKRALLYELDLGIQLLKRDHPDHPSVVRCSAVYHNLLRQWVEV